MSELSLMKQFPSVDIDTVATILAITTPPFHCGKAVFQPITQRCWSLTGRYERDINDSYIGLATLNLMRIARSILASGNIITPMIDAWHNVAPIIIIVIIWNNSSADFTVRTIQTFQFSQRHKIWCAATVSQRTEHRRCNAVANFRPWSWRIKVLIVR
jgi:hypothetical protein